MSGHLVNIHDERLPRLFKEAERRGLHYRFSTPLNPFDEGVMQVSSFSRRDHWYMVERVDESTVRCSCETKPADACSHAALACSVWFPVACYLRWSNQDREALQKFRLKIVTGAPLTLSEKRRLNKSIKGYYEVRPVSEVQVRDFDEAISTRAT